MLISAFRATLEEVLVADVVLHVRDISHEDTEAQSKDVETILDELGVAAGKVVEVWNKLDKLDGERREALIEGEEGEPKNARPLAISALTGEGVDRLLGAMEDRVAEGRALIAVVIGAADGSGLHWAYENAEVMRREDVDDGSIKLTLRVAQDKSERVRRRFSAPTAH